MFDTDLAKLYQVDTKALNQAVKRNKERFPKDFRFQLNDLETGNLRSQFVTSSYGGRRYNPYVFTEEGVAMLSSVLQSKKAIMVNIQIIRTFRRLREILSENRKLGEKIIKVENEVVKIYKILENLVIEKEKPKREIGFNLN